MHVPKRLMLPCYEPSIPVYHLCVGEQEASVLTHPTLDSCYGFIGPQVRVQYQLTITYPPTLGNAWEATLPALCGRRVS